MKPTSLLPLLAALPLCASADTFLVTADANCVSSFDGDAAILTITNAATLHVTGSGIVDVLLVGGGGGSGTFTGEGSYGCGGGGGGGVVYATNLVVMPGSYEITVGAGGIGGYDHENSVNVNNGGGAGGTATAPVAVLGGGGYGRGLRRGTLRRGASGASMLVERRLFAVACGWRFPDHGGGARDGARHRA